MIALIGYYWYALLIAFGFGLITAWWTWAQLAVPMPVAFDPDDEPVEWGAAPPPAEPAALADFETADEAAPAEQHDGLELAEEPAGEAQPSVESDIAVDDAEEALPVEEADAPVFASADELGPAIAAASTVPEVVDHAGQDSPVAADAEAPDSPEPDAQDGEAEAHVPVGKAADDLMVIKGIGPQLDALLRSLGVERFADIAGWMPEDIERIDGQLGIFKGRILRDEWIGQARLLARGDMETFNQRYGHLS